MATASLTPDVPAVVVIVGRPNVGKSALFNRIVGRRQALVDSTPGLTRDRLYADVRWKGVAFRIVDTGGLQLSGADRIQKAVEAQVAQAMEEACLAVWVCDARQGVVPLDGQVASWLRRWNKPVLVAANKAENERERLTAHEFTSLGFGSPWPVSSLHGTGIGDLLDAVVGALKGKQGTPVALPSPDAPIRVAIIGRPNVGKSSLINRLLNEERVLVDEAPGTTRDPVEAAISYRGKVYCLLDTAGVRSKRTLKTRMEAVARLKSLQALRHAHVCVGVLEAPSGITRDDLRLLDQAVRAGRPLCLVVNKWDLLDPELQKKSADDLASGIARRAPFLRFAPVIGASAKTGFQVLKVLDKVRELAERASRRLTVRECREILEQIRGQANAPAGVRHANWIRLAQAGVSPPVFHLLARSGGEFRRSDLQFLEAGVRKGGGFEGVPIQIRILNFAREERKRMR